MFTPNPEQVSHTMTVTIEKAGAVWTVIHDRPEARNAMDPASAAALVAAFETFDRDDSASVAVFWGAGGAFCAGWDLKYGASLLAGGADPLADLNFPRDGGPIPRGPMGPSRLALSKPVIAAIEGPAVAGGMELALWADLRVMATDAYMGVYCRRWGVPLIDGGTVRLPRLIGQGRALDIILTGRKVDAQECHQIGLCERLTPPGQARTTAEALAHEIARFPQACVRADRHSVYAAHGQSVHDGLVTEWAISKDIVVKEGLAGAARFASGKGRSGNFGDIG
jgi:enoyl-CoA hydratase